VASTSWRVRVSATGRRLVVNSTRYEGNGADDKLLS